MRIVDLSMTVEECDSAPFAPEEKYFKLKPIIKWEDKGFVSNVVQMTVHAGTHVDSPHHFFRDKPSIEQLPLGIDRHRHVLVHEFRIRSRCLMRGFTLPDYGPRTRR